MRDGSTMTRTDFLAVLAAGDPHIKSVFARGMAAGFTEEAVRARVADSADIAPDWTLTPTPEATDA